MISIVVPIYNQERFLRKCLQSIQNQTFTDYEVILINDGSTDSSREICEEFIQNDSRFRLINQENGGLSVARNVGMQYVTRPYLTFMDSDDWVEKDYLEILYNGLLAHDAEMSVCGYFIDEDDEVFTVWDDGQTVVWNRAKALTELLINKTLKDYAWGRLYKTELFENVVFPKGMYFEDAFVMYQVVEKVEKLVKINLPKYHYVQHDQNITADKTKSKKKELDSMQAVVHLYEYTTKNSNQLLDAEAVKLALTRRLYRTKKQSIRRFSIYSDDFKEISRYVNPKLAKMLSDIDAFKFGFFRYIGGLLTLYAPITFAIPLYLKGKKERI